MKRKVAPVGLLVAVFAVALFAWLVLPTPAVQANVIDGVGEWSVEEDVPPPNHGTSGDDGDPGYEADPDTFQIDSWVGADLEVVEGTQPPARTWPVSGQFGWLASWLLAVFVGRHVIWGIGI